MSEGRAFQDEGTTIAKSQAGKTVAEFSKESSVAGA